MPKVGIEPTWNYFRQILSLVRIPISPLRHEFQIIKLFSECDLNLIQAHKALDMASQVCADGGTIILLAECVDGLGRKDFLDWFGAKDSNELAEKLCENYQVNGQSAWSLLRKAEKFNIQIVTSLEENETRLMRLHKARNLEDALSKTDSEMQGYVLPFGAKFLLKS